MYPESILFGVGLYEILFIIGVFSAMLTFRLLADRANFSAPLQNAGVYSIVFAVLGGYFSSVLFQAAYNAMENGSFALTQSTGSTFYGGLIGGVLAFLLFYFTVGKRMTKDRSTFTRFPELLAIAPCSITIAHGFGRLGCLMAGCCYGKPTDAWFGVYMKHIPHKVIPTQLFEAIFLFILCAFLIVRVREKAKYNASLYLIAYGIWRFFIEFARGDDRGATLLPFLSPSQLTAVLLIAFGIVLIFLEKKLWERVEQMTAS